MCATEICSNGAGSQYSASHTLRAAYNHLSLNVLSYTPNQLMALSAFQRILHKFAMGRHIYPRHTGLKPACLTATVRTTPVTGRQAWPGLEVPLRIASVPVPSPPHPHLGRFFVCSQGAQFGHMVEARDGDGADVVVVQSPGEKRKRKSIRDRLGQVRSPFIWLCEHVQKQTLLAGWATTSHKSYSQTRFHLGVK